MRAQYVSRLLTQPWNLDKLRARTILANLAHTVLRSERPAEDAWGDPLPKMRIIGDVAVIPIAGVVSLNVPQWIKEYGLNLTDANDLRDEMQQALADPNVALIVYDCDSPGGLSLAGDMLFDVTERANKKKPVFAFCGNGSDMASTCYEAVASCTAILGAPFAAGIGCIGTYLAWLDDTEFWAQMGIKLEVFRSGELKGLGEDALSEAQRAYLQGMVDEHGAKFRGNVLKYRSQIAPADMEGQWFEGTAAARRGFTAGIADDLNAAIAKFRKMI